MEEIWKDIEGYDGYQVSNLGRVKSLAKTWIAGRLCSNRYHPDMLLRIKYEGNGYASVNFKGKNHRLHRLVAKAFINNPHNYAEVSHINANKLDNISTNLEWCSHQQNITHAEALNLRTPCRGERVNTAKLTEVDIINIRKDIRKRSIIAHEYNVGVGNIGRIQRYEAWKHVK